ncbi:receptor-like protein 9a [Hibiscus syriacus]|uniref:receptor-like protein 9a n=1 Tax=Hibiscus syriacus TaxID=106335 RepID=UPI0019220305|nr:receptor-like protein 9a [Hibiscus syriacus]
MGTIPSSFNCMTSLRVLELSKNKLEGKIFSENFKLLNLRDLKLDGNNFSERIPDLLSKSPLLALDVSNNTLSGGIPRWMGNMSSLQRIILSNNHLEGSIPIEFCQLDFLVLVDFSVNNILGSIPSCFNPSQIIQRELKWQHSKLDWWTFELELSSVKHQHLPRRDPNGVMQVESLECIDLSHNNLSGQIPPCLKITTLGDLDFVNVTMTGPSEFLLSVPIDFSMKNGYNSYKGRIISLVSGIDLSCNKLVGEIPPQIGNLHKILGLNLSHNSLTGPIPPTFDKLRKIESVDLSYNKLSGSIPSQLVGLSFMVVFNVSFNNFSEGHH